MAVMPRVEIAETGMMGTAQTQAVVISSRKVVVAPRVLMTVGVVQTLQSMTQRTRSLFLNLLQTLFRMVDSFVNPSWSAPVVDLSTSALYEGHRLGLQVLPSRLQTRMAIDGDYITREN